MRLEEIKEHWENAGKSLRLSDTVTPTSRDPYLGELERNNILRHLNGQANALEIGCGDNLHSVYYAQRVKSLIGVELAESLVRSAQNRLAQAGVKNVTLKAASVLDIDKHFPAAHFDVIISQRCLINLPNWAYQQEALLKLHTVLKPGGLLLLTEGFQEHLDELNNARQQFNLPAIRVVDYNRNFTLAEFDQLLPGRFEIVEQRNYGAYLFFSRVYHPLSVFPEQPKHDSQLNLAAMQIATKLSIAGLEKYSYNLFYCLKKGSH